MGRLVFYMRCLVLAGTGLLMSCGSVPSERAATPRYAIPASVMLTATASRYASGGAFVAGTTNLPDGVRLGIELKDGNRTLAFDFHMRVKSGRYLSAPFRSGNEPLRPGKYVFRIFTYFNGLWQSNEVLGLIGENGSNLKTSALIHSDDAGNRLLEYETTLAVPPFRGAFAPPMAPNLSPEGKAIEIVKSAVPVVDGHLSSTRVEESIEHYLQRSYFQSGKGWTASRLSGDTYRVTFDLIYGDDRNSQHDQALWNVNTVNGAVVYLNRSAKNFSQTTWAD
jgi:hypothetical protein